MPTINRTALDAALAKGQDLGEMKDWKVTTAGAEVRFSEAHNNQQLPTLTVDVIKFTDPAPQDIVTPLSASLKAEVTLAGVEAIITKAISDNKDFFDAKGVTTKGANETFGIQNLRREAFIDALKSLLKTNALSAADKAKVGELLLQTKEKLILGRDYQMQTGSQHNYWPYSNNFVAPLEKMLASIGPSHPAYVPLKARIQAIYNRKQVEHGSYVDEGNIEKSTGMTVILKATSASDFGHRVSLAKGSRKDAPLYEVLTVRSSGLPAGFEQYADAKIVRVDNKLVFDWAGPKAQANVTGTPVPKEIEAHIQARSVRADECGLRPLQSAESERADISWDWDQNYSINPGDIDISWWGHCHNESPANQLDLTPKNGVTWYKAGEKEGTPLQQYSVSDLWDVVGNLMADAENGYQQVSGSGYVSFLEQVDFVGDRNRGGHDGTFKTTDGRSIMLDMEVTQWFNDATGQPYPTALKGFRTAEESADGKTFAKNPLVTAAQGDIITLSGLDRPMSLTVKCLDLDGQGYADERKIYVRLDPKQDKFETVGSSIITRPWGNQAGTVEMYLYNAKTKALKTKRVTVSEDPQAPGQFKRVEGAESAPVSVKAFDVRQETTFDSVKEIHEFVTTNTGLPFVFDTAPDVQVWNYPVNFVRVEQQSRTEAADGVYTRYRLTYRTEGGPSGSAEYIIKRNGEGRIVDACALTPMPDFAFRQNKLKLGAVAVDDAGKPVYNTNAYENGYLRDASGSLAPGLALYERQLKLLYASLSSSSQAYVYEAEDGKLLRFATKAELDAAITERQALDAQQPVTQPV